MTRRLWLNPAFGIAGDMLLAALLDAGANEVFVRDVLKRLDLPGWDLESSRTTRRGLACLDVRVTVPEATPHRTWSSIDELLASGAKHDDEVMNGARKTFAILADVEAERHSVSRDDVVFHEVGAIDAIIDIVGSWAALVSLEVDEVHSAAPALGAGTTRSEHGLLAHPAPATLGLLMESPISGLDTSIETTTPTGAALLVTMVNTWGPVPAGTLVSTGYGAGDLDPQTHANILGVSVVDGNEAPDMSAVVVESNVDDVTPEILGHLIDRALAEGADDAWIAPIVMKKSRPGHQIRILCSPALQEHMIDLILRETGTLGVRILPIAKRVASRQIEEVVVDGMQVRVKVGPYGAKPESTDVIRVATETGKSALRVTAEALDAWAEDKRDKAN